MDQSNKTNFFDIAPKDFLELPINPPLKPFNVDQIFQWAYRKKEYNPSKWSNISKGAREYFLENVHFTLPKIVLDKISSDGTRKFIIGLFDGKSIETVLIPMANERLTLCISSQVGCALACEFCHTGLQGFVRHLSSSEIIGQYLLASSVLDDSKRISNIVFMGQGEPLHNFNATKTAAHLLVHPLGIGLGTRKVTLSTSGLVPQIKKLDEFPPINLAISLHAVDNETRNKIMPINKKYPLEVLLGALDDLPLRAYRRITYEYILIDGINDRKQDIQGLIQKLNPARTKINLIPFNPFPGSLFKAPSRLKVEDFCEQLASAGLTCTIRATKGDDILAACGQLNSNWMKTHAEIH